MEKVQYNGNNLREFISKSTVFNHLSEEELDQMPIAGETVSYKKGAIIYEEGTRINGFFVVCKGIIKIFKTGFENFNYSFAYVLLSQGILWDFVQQ